VKESAFLVDRLAQALSELVRAEAAVLAALRARGTLGALTDAHEALLREARLKLDAEPQSGADHGVP